MIPYGDTAETTSKLVRHHKVQKTTFDITKACDDAQNQKILAAFHNDYVEVVANANIWFAQTTTIELINHLYDSYVTITPSEM